MLYLSIRLVQTASTPEPGCSNPPGIILSAVVTGMADNLCSYCSVEDNMHIVQMPPKYRQVRQVPN